MIFLKIPITIYSSEEDVQKLLGQEERTPEDFDSIDDYLDYKSSLQKAADKAPLFHQKFVLINPTQIESIDPIFRIDSTKEDELQGNFQSSMFTLISGERYNCNWSIEEVEQQLIKQGIVQKASNRKPRVIKNVTGMGQ